jgi:hypothetical protein
MLARVRLAGSVSAASPAFSPVEESSGFFPFGFRAKTAMAGKSMKQIAARNKIFRLRPFDSINTVLPIGRVLFDQTGGVKRGCEGGSNKFFNLPTTVPAPAQA